MRPCSHFGILLRFIQLRMGCAPTKLIDRKAKHASSSILDMSSDIQRIEMVYKSKKLHKTPHRHSSSHDKDISSSNCAKHHRKKRKKSDHSKHRHGSSNCNNSSASKVTKNRSMKERTAQAHFDPRITAKYNIKALIGKGTFSRVLRVENRVSKQPYALKVIDAPAGKDAFEAELSILRRVNHPNVIKLIEVFESDSRVYMVMELATGGNLLDKLEMKGSFCEDDSRKVIEMVVSGVKYLHNVGVTHRDLKPDNLLYYHPGSNSRIMITDFGLASTRKASGSSYMHTICGTPQYIAPEIVARKPYTCAVDMWAIGVIAYILLFGSFPFDADHDAQIFKLILRGKISTNDSVWKEFSKEAKSFIFDLLKHDPMRRLTASRALEHPWLTSTNLTYSQESINISRKSSSVDNRDPSQRSTLSVGSSRSGRSISSLRSGHHRVQLHHLEALSSDPEFSSLM